MYCSSSHMRANSAWPAMSRNCVHSPPSLLLPLASMDKPNYPPNSSTLNSPYFSVVLFGVSKAGFSV